MGLDCYVDVPETIEFDGKGKISYFKSKQEVGYWRRCWFLHQLMADYYTTHIDETEIEFNCVYVELTDDLLTMLHQKMCDEAYRQSLSFSKLEYEDIVDTDDINELKNVIEFKQDNPETKIYYHGWY